MHVVADLVLLVAMLGAKVCPRQKKERIWGRMQILEWCELRHACQVTHLQHKVELPLMVVGEPRAAGTALDGQ